MNDEEIVEDVLQEREESESENEDEASSNAVTPLQACAAFDTALEWLEFKGNTLTDFPFLTSDIFSSFLSRVKTLRLRLVSDLASTTAGS